MNMHAIIWLILFVVLLVFEFLTMGLTTIWFAIGAVVAFIAALFHAIWWIQFALFIVVSFILLIVTRPIAIVYVNKKTVKTNVDSIIGNKGRVTQKIDNDKAEGYVSVNGVDWSARSEDGCVIDKDTFVEVKLVSGNKLIVAPVMDNIPQQENL